MKKQLISVFVNKDGRIDLSVNDVFDGLDVETMDKIRQAAMIAIGTAESMFAKGVHAGLHGTKKI